MTTTNLNLQTAIDWLETAKIGQKDHISQDEPFFYISHDTDANPLTLCTDLAFTNRIVTLTNQVNLPSILQYAYLILGSEDREFTLHEWTFMSIKTIENRLDVYHKGGQHQVCDLAHRYMGMGHIEVITLDIETGLVFLRHDGGSSDWDRHPNWEFIRDFDPATSRDRQATLETLVCAEPVHLDRVN